MKKIIFGLLCIFTTSTLSFAQKHEIGVYAGVSNLVGDIGKTDYILHKPLSLSRMSEFGLPIHIGVLYRMNFNPYQTLRFNLGYTNIQFNDKVANEIYRNQRGNYGTNSIYSLESIFEYQFLPVNNEQKSPMLSPYIFGGIGAMLYSSVNTTLDFSNYQLVDATGAFTPPTIEDYPEEQRAMANKLTMSIPFGVGLKYKFNYNWALFGEITFRPTFTDNIDYSNMQESQVKILYDKEAVKAIRGGNTVLSKEEINTIIKPYVESKRVGNLNSNDWVNTVTLGISYSFGRPPCYCD
ncbi:outer membrane beta-barrel protein [Riemerella anatipestifer]|uniref:type IX secretion system protein PorG n=1 Tax=Riemerella anatipestifer TaxID=34085 RepID=UPI001BD98BA4|nr:DUF6089 family protein [Riemerella anatipestifer]MBT0534449.1 outer membrane beta-barrel protein [Riemerella anatipestifer]MBT0540325.1 outer membrane beta-barrel protein [Riemerella anatipestifer]MBT0544249.1 outer membrane beta-barrel protein [Riemerella anatipestifer]MBT0546126.1 outer membrane beta-barrel protein [Riemerella anatipestifer]MBT0548152.1 outer membrane beta-barrel protein [Riemerella anatipestifer]